MTRTKSRSKFGNVRVEDDGHQFDSRKEHRRYLELRMLAKAGVIRDLRVHPSWPVVVNGVKVCVVELDFAYRDLERGKDVYEDTKGVDTAMSRLKRKLLLAAHGVETTLL